MASPVPALNHNPRAPSSSNPSWTECRSVFSGQANGLGLSVRTVENHRANLMGK